MAQWIHASADSRNSPRAPCRTLQVTGGLIIVPRIPPGVGEVVKRYPLTTLPSVPHFPEEDLKLRATSIRVRRGGNCPNTMEVLQQLLRARDLPPPTTGGGPLKMHLVSPLPERHSQATAQIISSFPPGPDAAADAAAINFEHCLFREGHQAPASSYIFRSEATGSRTIVNHNELLDMTTDEFLDVVEAFRGQGGRTWWHFEGRVPETTLGCIRALRRVLGDGDGDDAATVSVEVERPGRAGLRELAAEADVVFYSKSWAEDCGYLSAEDCLRKESLTLPRASLAMVTWGAEGAWCMSLKDRQLVKSPVKTPVKQVVDSVGAGDTFVAGMLYGLICQAETWDVAHKLGFAVALATLKVQREGFGGLGDDIRMDVQSCADGGPSVRR
ncbi:D-sorbose [Colletotrichum orchidophilum]|uniref:D-sorbose n=1 Tax=Colletotrichum orchidophilum TaxID=1209926 RepID=A0A1G4B3F0_9PEZI|nr:D-sorbose [Colletotrichum orchidophilum]OHE95940.1 D-sorbose [Colletotrichum orchidophilum]